jgi:hypothetical protein
MNTQSNNIIASSEEEANSSFNDNTYTNLAFLQNEEKNMNIVTNYDVNSSDNKNYLYEQKIQELLDNQSEFKN